MPIAQWTEQERTTLFHSFLKPFCHDYLASLPFIRTELGQLTYGKNKHFLQRPPLLVGHLLTDGIDLDDFEKLSNRLIYSGE